MKKYTYWNTDKEILEWVKKEIEHTAGEIERHEVQEGIVFIHVPDSVGSHIPEYFISNVRGYESEEEYPYETGSEEELLVLDCLLEEIDDELQELVEEFDLVPSGYVMNFGWYDGGICTTVHTIS